MVEAQSAWRGHDCRLLVRRVVLRGEKFWLSLREILEPRGRDPEMLLHGVARGGRIFSLDRSRDCGVLVQAGAKLLQRQHSQSACSFQMDTQRLKDIGGARHAQASGQYLVERHVESVKRRSILLGDRPDLLPKVGGELVLVGAVHPPGGLGRNLAFERTADEQTLARVLK